MRQRQSGMFLIGAVIAVAVFGILMTVWIQQQSAAAKVSRGERLGLAVATLGQGVDAFVVRHYKAIADGWDAPTIEINDAGGHTLFSFPVHNHAIALTAEQIIQAMHLRGIGNRPPPPMGGGNYRITIRRVEQGNCVDEKSCDIETLVYLDQPILNTYRTAPDTSVITAAMNRIVASRIGQGGSMIGVPGVSHSRDGGATIHFLDGFTAPGQANAVVEPIANPVPGRAGILVLRGRYQMNAMSALLRRDGSLAMTGDLKLQAPGGGTKNNIVGAGRIETESIQAPSTDGHLKIESHVDLRGKSLSGASSVTTESLTVNRGVNSARLSVARDRAGNGSLRVDKGSVWVDDGYVWAQKELWSTSGVLRLDGAKTLGGDCSAPNEGGGHGIARDKDGKLLSCQNNIWQMAQKEIKEIGDLPPDLVDRLARDGGMWNLETLAYEVPCDEKNTFRYEGAYACRLTSLKNGCAAIPRMIAVNGGFEIPPLGLSEPSAAKTHLEVTCMSAKHRGVMNLVKTPDGKYALGSMNSIIGASVKPATASDIASLLGLNAYPGISKIKTYRWDQCFSGGSGARYNLDELGDGKWDYCRLDEDDPVNYCTVGVNQRREVYRDDNGAWRFLLKQRGGSVTCLNFAK